MFHENVSGYGNHNYANTVGYRQLEITKLIRTSKQLDLFNPNFEFTTDDSSNENRKLDFEIYIGPCTFNA